MLLEIINFFFSPFGLLFRPYYDALKSQKTKRAAIKTVFMASVGVVLVAIALLAYLSFYMMYIPSIAHSLPIYLQYKSGISPYAVVDFTDDGRYDTLLTADQAYDVSVKLYVPSSDRNIALGNFMIDLELKAKDNETVKASSRPCILTYQSGLLRVFSTLWRLIPLLLGFTKEDQMLEVTMLESMIESANKPVTHALITVSNSYLDVYSAQLQLNAHFRGLRYYMYYHSISTAITFTSMFLSWEIMFSVVAWRLLVSWWQNKTTTPVPDGRKVPTASDETSNVTDDNQDDETWLEVGRRGDTPDDNVTTTESESEYESSRPGSVISPAGTSLVSESGETSYNTDSYTDDDEPHDIISRPLDDDNISSVATETETDDQIDDDYDDDDDNGSVTPTTRSRRSTLSTEASANESEIDMGTSTARSQNVHTTAYPRKPDSGNSNKENNLK